MLYGSAHKSGFMAASLTAFVAGSQGSGQPDG